MIPRSYGIEYDSLISCFTALLGTVSVRIDRFEIVKKAITYLHRNLWTESYICTRSCAGFNLLAYFFFGTLSLTAEFVQVSECSCPH